MARASETNNSHTAFLHTTRPERQHAARGHSVQARMHFILLTAHTHTHTQHGYLSNCCTAFAFYIPGITVVFQLHI